MNFRHTSYHLARTFLLILGANTRSRSSERPLRNPTQQQVPPTTPKEAFRSPDKSAEGKRRKKSKRRSSKSERTAADLSEADVERRLMKELIAEVIGQSISEVTSEESRNETTVVVSPQLQVSVAVDA